MRLTLSATLLVLSFWANPLQGQTIDLDGDTDRSGVVDGSTAEESLENSESVIVVNNCDRDNTAATAGEAKPDNTDDVINGPEDRKDLEPLIIRKIAGPPSGQVSVRLKAHSTDDVEEKKRIRIFKSDGSQIIGPTTSTTYNLTADDVTSLQAGDVTLLVEGLAFGTSVKVAVFLDETEQDSLIVEVAPFLLTPHSQNAVKNYVVNTGSLASSKYVTAFKDACTTAGVTAVVLSSPDVWIEDEMSWGYTETPRIKMPVALHLFRLRPLKSKVRELLGPDVGYATVFDYGPDPGPGGGPDSIHYGGNLEVTPPTAQHPFGRVYYGSIKSVNDPANTYHSRGIEPRYQKFFKRQKLQEPIDLNSDWLAVGHVDELVSFVPKSDGGFILLIASPKLALDIARSMSPDTPLDPKYGLMVPGLDTVGDLFNYGQLQRTFEDYNMDMDFKTFGLDHSSPDPNSIKGKLKASLNLDESDIVEVPILGFNIDVPDVWQGLALTPGMVNLNSMSLFSLIPEPFLQEFKTPVQNAMTGVGQTPIFINDWSLYHANMGEVHCGSNTLREPFSKKWWQN